MATNPYTGPAGTTWKNSDGQSGFYGPHGPDAPSERVAAPSGPGSEFDRMVSMAAKYRAATAAGNKLGAMTPEMQYGAKLLDSGYKPGGVGGANSQVVNKLLEQGVRLDSFKNPTPAQNPNPMGFGADQLNQQQMGLLQKRSAVTAENVNPARPGQGMAQGGMGTGGTGPATPGAGAQVQQASPSMRQLLNDRFNQVSQKIQADIAAGRLSPEGAMTDFQESYAQDIRNLDEAEKANGGPMSEAQYRAARQRAHDEDVKRNANPMGYGADQLTEEQQIMLRKQQAGAGPATPAAMDAYYQKDAQDQAERARRIRAAQAANGIAPMDTSGTGPVRSGFGASNELPASSDVRPGAARNYSYGRQPPGIDPRANVSATMDQANSNAMAQGGMGTGGAAPVRSDYGFGMAPPEERPADFGFNPYAGGNLGPTGPDDVPAPQVFPPQGGFAKPPGAPSKPGGLTPTGGGMGPLVQPPRGGTQPGMPKAPPPRGGFGGSTMTRPEITRPAVTRPAVTRPAVTRPAVTRPAVTRPAANPNPMGYGADQLTPQQMSLVSKR